MRSIAGGSRSPVNLWYRQGILSLPRADQCRPASQPRERLGVAAAGRLRFTVRFRCVPLKGTSRRRCTACSSRWRWKHAPARSWRRLCSPSRSTRRTTISFPRGCELEPGCFVLVPFGPQSRIGVVWDKSVGGPVGEPGKPVDPKKLKTITARLDVPPLPMHHAALCRVDRQVHAGAARHDGAHDDERARRVRADEAALRRDAGRRRGRAAAHDAGAQAGAGDCRRRGDPRQGGAGAGGRVLVRRRRRARRLRQPRRGGDPRQAPAAARSAPSRHRVRRGAGRGGACAALGGRRRQLLDDAARRRHRLRQDGGLFRGGGAHAGARPAGGDHAAGNRAHRSVHAPLRGALRLRAGRMAFGAVGPRARPRVEAGGDGRSARHRRGALGAVPAVQRSRPHHRRRGARRRLQAGRPRALPGARHGGGARQPRRLPGHPRLGDAVDRDARQRAHRPLPPRRPAGTLFRRRSCPTSPPSICARPRPTRANGCRRCWPMPSPRRWPRGSSRCCSSTGAATPR